jgi:fermentation-respiration switch protein FrsA (DUF1100 family)
MIREIRLGAFMFARGFLFALAMFGTCASAQADALYSYDTAAPLAPIYGAARKVSPGVIAQDVSFTGASGHRVTAEIVRGTAKGQHPGLLFVHWLGDPKTTNHTEFEADAIALARKGGVSLLVDTMWADPKWFDSVGPDAKTDGAQVEAQVIDLRRSLDMLLAQKQVDANRIAYVGHDFGAMFGALLAGADSRPKTFVLMAGVPTLVEWYRLGKDKLPDLAGYTTAMAPYDVSGGLHALSGRKLLFQFATKDGYVPEAKALAFIGAAAGPKTAIFYASDHDLAVPEALADRDGWLIRQLF